MLYAPIPATVPRILAPASPTSSPPPSDSPVPFDPDSPTFAIPLKWQAGVDRLVALDAPRRKYGLPHLRPPNLGLPQLICTSGINGLWRPTHRHPVVSDDESNEHALENGSIWSDDEGRLPRDEAEAREWAQRRRLRRRARKTIDANEAGAAPRKADPQVAAQSPSGAQSRPLVKRLPPTLPKSRTASRATPLAEGVMASTSSSRAPKPQQLVTSHFTATKTSSPGAAAAQQVKKRPAGSPPPNPPLSRASSYASNGRASKRAVSPASSRKAELQSLVPETVSNVGSVASSRPGNRAALGRSPSQLAVADDDGAYDEVLEEFGCTQPAFADPTQSRPATASTAGSKKGMADARPLPFSSPGLRDDLAENDLARASTPARRPDSIPSGVPAYLPSPNSLPMRSTATESQAKRPFGEVTPRPQPPTRTATTDSTASGLGPSTITGNATGQRKSLARLGSKASLRAGSDDFGGGGSNGAETLERQAELEDIERFLQAEVSQ